MLMNESMNHTHAGVFYTVDIPTILEKDVDYGEGSFKHTFDLQATSTCFLIYYYYHYYRCNGN